MLRTFIGICWALTNLRPLEYIANIRKGNKVA